MPKARLKPAPIKPVAPTPPPVQEPISIQPPIDLPVLYDTLEIIEYSTTSPNGPLDIANQKVIIGWETENEYQQRKVKEFPNTKPDAWMFGDVYHCRNVLGEKVRTNSNAHNRPFDEEWCKGLIQIILRGQWAGPYTIPGETVNGETIRISRYGRVLSGQHQMTACILAGEILLKARQDGADPPNKPKFPAWRTHGEPFLETIIIRGMSEDPRVLMTIDYVKPRTAADIFYTSEVFKNSTSPQRKELCRMLAAATDLLWDRTDAKGYRTHPELVGFLERHKRLLKCVEHLFAKNSAESGRKISKLRLSAGQCVALMYIMASAGNKTDGDVYRNEDPPTEKNLDWSLWDKAEQFWTLLADGKYFIQVRHALGRLVESDPSKDNNQGLGGRGPEKLAILDKAWALWKDHPDSAGPPFSDADLEPNGALCLSYNDLDDSGNKLPNGEIRLLDVADFYGIDCPESIGKSGKKPRTDAPMPPPLTRREIERATEEAIKRREKNKKKIQISS